MEKLPNILNPCKLRALAREWLEEDCPNFDLGSLVLGDEYGKARLLCKSSCMLAGIPFFNAIFQSLNCEVQWLYDEGQTFDLAEKDQAGRVEVAIVSGLVKDILRGERPALNVISRASGVASKCNELMRCAREKGWNGKIAGTRKTTPGFRLVEKYAVLISGADTHRYDLSSTVMLKDNHIWSVGSIKQAVAKVLSHVSFTTKIEVECRNLEEGFEAAEAGAQIIMFDNMLPKDLQDASRALKKRYPKVIVECSGGITEENISQYFHEDVDVISTSKVVQGYSCIDFSLKIIK